jgi:hypothetical protein
MTTTTTTPLGLSLKLSPDAVASLRQSRYIVVEASASQHDDDENSSRVADDESFDGADHNNYSSLHHPYYDNDDDDDVASERDDDEYDDEWDQIIMPVSSDLFLSAMNDEDDDDEDDDDDEQVTTTPSQTLDEDSCVQSCYEARISDDDEEKIMSQSPPPSLPLVVVDLERLCGFRPSTSEEAHELKQQVMEALSSCEDGTRTTTPHKHDCPSRHGHFFEGRVQELFESHMARHGDSASLLFSLSSTTMDANDFSKAIIPYPELTCRSSKSDTHPSAPPTTTTTARLWKRLLQPHRIAVVDRLRRHLRNCNRPLSWKVDMSHELHKLLRQEEQPYRASLQLEHWNTKGRKARLDQLYRVREVFALRLEAAEDKLRVLKKHKWDDATAKELERLRWTTESTAGDGSSSSLAAAAAALDDFDKDWNGFGRTTTSRSCHDSGYDSTSPSDDDDDDDDKHFLESTTGGDAAALLPPAVDVNQRSKKARQRTSAITKTRKCRLQSQQEAARIEQAAAYAEEEEEEEERVRELCMTPELKMALAVVKSLEERMQQVDDLLESLQEEEWADEENGIFLQTRAESTASENRVSSSSSAPDAPPTTAKMATELSLLDGVLAMILGSLPQSTEISTAEHYKFIHKEHQEIVSEWKEYFGRLPSPSPHRVGRVDTVDTATRPVQVSEMTRKPSVPSTDSDVLARRPPTVEELKKSLGITDNSELDWDDLDDEEAKTSADPPRPKKSAVGLRPGGKAIR